MPRLTFPTAVLRALRLRCPRCGGGRLFFGFFRMYPECPNCKLKYERAPGYFLGSAYFNYGVTAAILTVAYVGLHFGVGLSNRALTPWLVAFCVLFPLFFFRYARSLWLAMDCYFDVTGFEPGEE
jgi:uncharacterized protein (DUF983 family)